MSRTVIPILLYHSVSNMPSATGDRFAVSRSDFLAHIAAIKASARVPLLVSEVAAGLRQERNLPLNPVGITFDDGFADTFEACQMVIAAGLAATVYVTTGQTDHPDRLSSEQLRELAGQAACELGAHGETHRRFDEVSTPDVIADLSLSKARLEEIIESEVYSFAYPHGAHDRRVRQAVMETGYLSGAAVKNALSHSEDDPYAIARWTVTAGTSPGRVSEVLSGKQVNLAWRGERLRTKAYRAFRRSRRRVGAVRGGVSLVSARPSGSSLSRTDNNRPHH